MTFEDLYKRVPTVLCQGLCFDSCGSILLQRAEQEAIEDYVQRLFDEKGIILVGPLEDRGQCPYLTRENRCAVHPVRPLVCRMYGAAEGLECPHGCPSMGKLTRQDADRLFALAQQRSPTVGLNFYARAILAMVNDQ